MFRMCESPSTSPIPPQFDQTESESESDTQIGLFGAPKESITTDLTGPGPGQNTSTISNSALFGLPKNEPSILAGQNTPISTASYPTLFSFGLPKKEPSTSNVSPINFSKNIEANGTYTFCNFGSIASASTSSPSQSSGSNGLRNPVKSTRRRFSSKSNSTPEPETTISSIASKLGDLNMSMSISTSSQNEGHFQFKGSSNENNTQENIIESNSNWRMTKRTHAERMEYLLESGFLSDVTFTVGPEKAEIKGHRAILAIGSPVFQAMLTGKLYVEGQQIPIPDLSPLEFKALLKYLYVGEEGISTGTILPLYHAAKKFSVDELTQKCVDELIGSLTKDNVCHIYEQALAYNEVNLVNKSQEFIFKNARYVVETEGFLKLSQVNLMKIISRDELQVNDEIQLVKALYNWGQYECKNQKKDVTGDNLRLILKPIISQIRIPQMDASSFSIHVAPLEILSDKELISSLLFFNVSKASRSSSNMTISGFSSKLRNYFKPSGFGFKLQIRPESFKLQGSTCESIEHSGNWSSINFLVDTEIWIKSIGLYLYNYQDYTSISQGYAWCSTIGQDYLKNYTSNTSSSQYICKLKIEEEGMSQDFVEKMLKGSCDIQDIPFETPIHIQPNKNYTISLLTIGPETLGIKSSEQKFEVPINWKNGPITFSFLNAAQKPAEILKKISRINFFVE